MGFIGLVLVLVCAWLICQFIRKFGKAFFTRFIPKFFKVFIPKLCKIAMWTTLIISVLYVGFVFVDFTYHYAKNYVCRRDFLADEYMLPVNLVPQIKEHGVKKVWRRWYHKETYEYQYKEQEAIAREKAITREEPLTAKEEYKKRFDSNPGPFPNNFWWYIPNYLAKKYVEYKCGKEGHSPCF